MFMRKLIRDLQWFDVPFEFPIWDMKADEIDEIEGHKVIKPDLDTHVSDGHVAVITILNNTVACHVRDQLSELGFAVFTDLKSFLHTE